MNTFLILSVLFLAATNGANDNFKGVATLYGSRVAGYWTSLVFSSVMTLGGALASVFLAKTLLMAFTGKGLVPADVAGAGSFALAVSAGAGVTVALAAWRGLPISTTHALIGAMSGAGLVAAGTSMHFRTLGGTFVLPLLVSPLLALVPAWLLTRLMPRLATAPQADPLCLCVTAPEVVTADGALQQSLPGLTVDRSSACAAEAARPLARATAHGVTNALQYLFSGAVCFARGLNDTPKISALLLPAGAIDARLVVPAVGAAMVVGGLLGARRVARTMSQRITRLDLRSALAASLVTGLLVSTASVNGLPVSTTHVSVGGLAGGGIAERSLDRRVLTGIASAWLITLPVAALAGALMFRMLAG